MVELIIGHTTHDSTSIWVRGDRCVPFARVTLKPQGCGKSISSGPVALRSDDDYTGVVVFTELEANEPYRVVAEFAPNAEALERPTAGQAGWLRTFPEPGRGARFSFLLGSCNLSTARLTSLGALLGSALGTIAMSRSVRRNANTWVWPQPKADVFWDWKRPFWRVAQTFPGLLRLAASQGAWMTWAAVAQVTRFQQPEPRLSSPFAPLLEAIKDQSEERASFMIHAGDQIYFDIDAPSRPAEVDEYRRAYRQAWFEDPVTREVFASCPHYMILDDHEIIDSFENQPDYLENLNAGKKAYFEYVHSRQPGIPGSTFYEFEHDEARFFVLDTRTERFPATHEMIGPRQLNHFKRWLWNNKEQLKFVVSSVPFVAQLRGPRDGEELTEDDRNDKWCGDAFREQRGDIIDTIYKSGIERVIFLVGDMHCTYHATMRVGPPEHRIAIHEVAAGPISQVQFTRRNHFDDHYRGTTASGTPFSCLLRSFHGATAAAVRLTVQTRPPVNVRWTVVPTSRPSRKDAYRPPVLGGQISFPELRP